jgi:hypothetical protein
VGARNGAGAAPRRHGLRDVLGREARQARYSAWGGLPTEAFLDHAAERRAHHMGARAVPVDVRADVAPVRQATNISEASLKSQVVFRSW